MIEFFTGILGFLQTLVDFVIGFFKNLFFVISLVPQAVSSITSLLSYLPAFITVPILAIISISIVIAIINHWG